MTEPTPTDQSGNTYPVNSTFYTCCHSIGAHGFDCDNLTAPPLLPEPVNLDPEPELAPAILRWQELAEEAEARIDVQHDGDAERIMPIKRPPWADPEEDSLGTTVPNTIYRSSLVKVAATWSQGQIDETYITRAGVGVQVQMHGDGTTCIRLMTHRVLSKDKSWRQLDISLTPFEALEVIKVLHGAVDLIGAER
jgi:hypothetical protein